jgi:hypothetical protein
MQGYQIYVQYEPVPKATTFTTVFILNTFPEHIPKFMTT